MWTIFPIPLGEAASFDPEMAEKTARATALETTASGIHWTFVRRSMLCIQISRKKSDLLMSCDDCKGTDG